MRTEELNGLRNHVEAGRTAVEDTFRWHIDHLIARYECAECDQFAWARPCTEIHCRDRHGRMVVPIVCLDAGGPVELKELNSGEHAFYDCEGKLIARHECRVCGEYAFAPPGTEVWCPGQHSYMRAPSLALAAETLRQLPKLIDDETTPDSSADPAILKPLE